MSPLDPGRKSSLRNRHSLFARNSFSVSTLLTEDGKNNEPSTLLKKRRTLSSLGSLSLPTNSYKNASAISNDTDPSQSSSSNASQSMKRSTSLFGSKSFNRQLKGDFEDAYAAASHSLTSLSLNSNIEAELNPRNVICHGQVQISSFKFRKKRDYLVLTDLSLVRFKTMQRAVEIFSGYFYITKYLSFLS